MKKLLTVSAVLLLLALTFMAVDYSLALTRQEIELKIETYLSAEKADDYVTMASLLGVEQEELQRSIKDYMDGLKSYFADRLNLQLKELRFEKHFIIFMRPGKDEAFVGQEIYIYFEDAGRLRRQHEYSIFRVTFDENAHISWQPIGNSRGDFEDVGRES